MSTEYRYIGKPIPRKDAAEIVTGRAQFTDDIKFPNMLYAKILRSPYAHANITSIDTSKAEALPGVKAVLTYKNAPNWMTGTPAMFKTLDSKVRFVGDPVALVSAETEEIAVKALDLINVQYEVLPAVFDSTEAVKAGAPQLYADIPNNTLPRGMPLMGPKALQEIVRGDTEKGFTEADFIDEGTYAYENMPSPNPPETPACIALWENPNKLTVWLGSQGPFLTKMEALGMTGVTPPVNMHVINTHCGGSYGTKNTTGVHFYAPVLLAKAVPGRPVKLVYTKEEHIATFVLRLGFNFSAKVGMKKDGTLTAITGSALVNAGSWNSMSQGQIAVGCGEMQLMANTCENWNLQPSGVMTNRNAGGIVRGFGGQELKSAFIPLLMLTVAKAGLDPVEFFKKNFCKPGGGFFWRDGIWYVSRGQDYSNAMDEGARVFGWKDKWKGWLTPTSVNGTKVRGVGVGVHGNADVGEDSSEAWVTLYPLGNATLFAAVPEFGTAQRNSVAKMVAEILNLPFDNVDVAPCDTELVPYDFPVVGSRGTYACGSAACSAAQSAKTQLLELAATIMHAKPEDLDTMDGMIFAKAKPDVRIPWIAFMGMDSTITGKGRFDHDYTMPNFMMVYAEVEVDTETGKVDVIEFVVASDPGTTIDPIAVRMQLQGDLGSAGLDTAVFEETVLDRTAAVGRILNCNMIDYKWRPFNELPIFDQALLQTPLAHSHIFHAIGLGEIACAPGPCAALMAISNALGMRVYDYPMTPDKVLKALGKI